MLVESRGFVVLGIHKERIDCWRSLQAAAPGVDEERSAEGTALKLQVNC